MKKKKSMIVLAIFAAVLVLGVGYAAIVGVDLSISGTASTEERDLKVAFNGVTSVNANGTGATVTATSVDDELEATILVEGLSEVGQSVSATYTIKNEETDINAIVSVDEIENDKTDYFVVTTNYDSSDLEIDANSVGTITVTVTLDAMPVSADDSTATINIALRAEAE